MNHVRGLIISSNDLFGEGQRNSFDFKQQKESKNCYFDYFWKTLVQRAVKMTEFYFRRVNERNENKISRTFMSAVHVFSINSNHLPTDGIICDTNIFYLSIYSVYILNTNPRGIFASVPNSFFFVWIYRSMSPTNRQSVQYIHSTYIYIVLVNTYLN